MKKLRGQKHIITLRVSVLSVFTMVALSFCMPGIAQQRSDFRIDSLNQKLELATDTDKVSILIKLSALLSEESFEESLQYARTALNLALELGNKEKIAESYNRVGITYAAFEIYEEAIPFFEEASIIRRAIHDRKGLASTLGNMGITYYHLNRLDTSLACFEEQLALAYELNDDALIAGSNHNLGELYSYSARLDESIPKLENALQSYNKIGNYRKSVEVLNIIGSVFTRLGDYPEALEKYFAALSICSQKNYRSEIPFIENRIGELYLATGNLHQARSYSQSSLMNANEQGIIETVCGSYNLLSEYYTEMGDLEKALHYRSQCSQYKDSLYALQLNKKLALLQIRYDTENKDQEIQVLKRSEEIAGLELEKSKLFRNFMIILISIVSFFSVISLINMFQRRKTTVILKQQRKLQEEINVQLIESKKIQLAVNLTKSKFFTVLTHDLMEPFRALLTQTESLEKEAKKSNLLAIKKNSGIVYQSSKNLFQLLDNLLQWSRNQQGRIEHRPGYFDVSKTTRHIISLNKVSADRKNVKIQSELQEALFVYGDENHISVVLKNIMNNAIKYTNQGGLVQVSLTDKGRFAEIIVEDNGVGFQPEDLEKLFRLDVHITRKGTANESGTGLGLIIAQDLLLKNKGVISVESEQGKGTCITVKLPKTPTKQQKP